MRASAATGPQPALGADAAAIQVSVVTPGGEPASGPGDGCAYEMFAVDTVDTGGARLIAPLLLEIGEEITLRLVRGDARAEVRARVTAIERGAQPGGGPPPREAIAVVEFVDDDAAAQVRAVLGA